MIPPRKARQLNPNRRTSGAYRFGTALAIILTSLVAALVAALIVWAIAAVVTSIGGLA